jgi:hypothetical protein
VCCSLRFILSVMVADVMKPARNKKASEELEPLDRDVCCQLHLMSSVVVADVIKKARIAESM